MPARSVQNVDLAMMNCFSTTLVFGLSIAVWQISYPLSHWSAISLIPLVIFVFFGTYRNVLDRRRSLILATLRKDSSFLGLLTGGLIPALAAIIISTLSVSMIAADTLLATPMQIVVLLAIVAISALTYSCLVSMCRPQIRPLALSWFSAATAVFLVSTVFIVPYAIFEWSVVERPGFIRLGFDDAMSAALAQLPQRDDFLNQSVLALQLIDSTKLWLASRFTGTIAPGVLFAAHSTLICIVVSTSSVGVASFYKHHIERWAWRQPNSAVDMKNEDDEAQENIQQRDQGEKNIRRPVIK